MVVPSEEERQRRKNAARSWLDTHWTQPRSCPICGSVTWQVLETSQWVEFTNGDVLTNDPVKVTPFFGVLCQVCGYTFVMNALVAGVVQGPLQLGNEGA